MPSSFKPRPTRGPAHGAPDRRSPAGPERLRDDGATAISVDSGPITLSAVGGDDQALLILMRDLVAGGAAVVAQSLAAAPALASSSLRHGATRQSTQGFFFY